MNHNLFDTFDPTNPHYMANNNDSHAPFVNYNTTVNPVPHAPHGDIYSNINGPPAPNHFVNLPNTTFDSQPQINHQYDIYKFEIPGFEIIIRPKSDQIMNFNVNNLSMRSHSSTGSYSPAAVMPSQNQNYVNGNFASASYANSVNNINTHCQCHHPNIYGNNNNFHG